jgi:hypothetical protein
MRVPVYELLGSPSSAQIGAGLCRMRDMDLLEFHFASTRGNKAQWCPLQKAMDPRGDRERIHFGEAQVQAPEGGKVTVRVYTQVVGVVLMVVGNQWALGVSNTQ